MPAAVAPKTIAEALLKVQAEVPKLQKDSLNPHFGNRYVGLESLLPQILPVLQKNNLLLLQQVSNLDGAPALRTMLIHVPSADFVEDVMPLTLQATSPQAQGSALTYARRYSLMTLLSLVAEKDDDGQAASAPPRPDGFAGLTVPEDVAPTPGGLGGAVVL